MRLHSSASPARENRRSGESTSLDVGKRFAPLPRVEVFSLKEIAAVAGVPLGLVESRVLAGEVSAVDHFVSESDAIRLIREIVSCRPEWSGSPSFFAVLKSGESRPLTGLWASAGLHVLAVTLLVVGSLSLLGASNERRDEPTSEIKLVYFASPGPGGGGGGGGLQIPLPARRAARKAPEPSKVSSPVPDVRPPARPEPEPEPEPETPPPAVVTAPVVPKPADPVEQKGVLAPQPAAADQGSGSGGGAGTGAGQGVGEGKGSGIGEGSGGGEGGGPFRPGSGIEPPKLLREVKADYTDDARRAGIEGEVVLEIVVRRDGSVGDVRLRRGLQRGLDERAIAAVRQWRFTPATRRGTPVDVVVEVGVDFKLR